MKLYHPRLITRLAALGLLASAVFMGAAGCAPAQAVESAAITVRLTADGQTQAVSLEPGSSVEKALSLSGLSLGALDRVEPPAHTVLADGAAVRLIRVKENFELEEVVLPFQRQTLRNESLPLDTEVYLQRGQNGVEERTYRTVTEDGVEVSSRSIIKRVVVKEPVTEIVMVGVQAPFVSVDIPGRLFYLRDGSVWMMETSTGNRQAVITTGDLDGRIFTLSPDGSWLLFTRKSDQEGQINRLWARQVAGGGAQAGDAGLVDLKVDNVIHFADWLPGSTGRVIFSTAESRPAAPGWQANNDLNALSFSPNGWVSKWQEKPVLEANSGGVYGWWGTSFLYSPAHDQLAYTRPDGIGLLDVENSALISLQETIPLQTGADWAWAPGLAWAPGGNLLYYVDHVSPPGALEPEESPDFDLVALPLPGGEPIHLAQRVGMFAYPLVSPALDESGEHDIAFLQALFPEQSGTSTYRVMLMDRDGSNQRALFPGEQQSGAMTPGQNWGAWSPEPLPGSGHYALSLIYAGNLWLVDAGTGEAQQLTGDGLTQRVIWK